MGIMRKYNALVVKWGRELANEILAKRLGSTKSRGKRGEDEGQLFLARSSPASVDRNVNPVATGMQDRGAGVSVLLW